MLPDSILNMTAIAFLGLTIPLAADDERAGSQCIPLLLGHAEKGALNPDAGGFSEATREQLGPSAAYFTAFVERENGKVHRAFDAEARDIVIFRTTSGKNVIRIFNPRLRSPARN